MTQDAAFASQEKKDAALTKAYQRGFSASPKSRCPYRKPEFERQWHIGFWENTKTRPTPPDGTLIAKRLVEVFPGIGIEAACELACIISDHDKVNQLDYAEGIATKSDYSEAYRLYLMIRSIWALPKDWEAYQEIRERYRAECEPKK